MKKIRAICAFIMFPALLFAQQGGYIKFKVTVNQKEKGKELKLLKGEILPFFPDKEKDKIDILFGNDTLKMVTDLKKIEIVKNVSDHNGDKDQFVLSKKEENMIKVDLNPLNPYPDSVRFVTEDQKVNVFSKNKEFTISAKKAGRYPRLIIPGSPTLFYDALDLSIYKQKTDKKMPDENSTSGDFFGPLQLIIILVILSVSAAWFFWWYSRKKKKDRVPIYKKFNHQKLSAFADQNDIPLPDLIKYNPVINQKYLKLSEKEKQEIARKLKDIDLIIGYEKKPSETPPADPPPAETHAQTVFFEKVSSSEDTTKQANVIDLTELKTLLRSMEDRIIRKISDQNSNEQHVQQIKELKFDLDESKKTNERLTEKNGELQGEKNQAENDLYAEKNKSAAVQQTMNLLQEKIIPADFLREYGRQVLALVNFINSVVKKAGDCFQLFEGSDNQESQVVARLLLKFEKNRSGVIQNWQQIIQEIVTYGVTTDTELKRALKDFPQDADKVEQFKHLLFDEMLAKETSAILILSEEFRNLGKFFSNPSDSVIQAQSKFQQDSDQLVQKSTAVGLAPQYVSLFENYKDFYTLNKSLMQPVSAAYRHIGKFEKDTIIEICEFGFKTNFTESDTLVILSKYE